MDNDKSTQQLLGNKSSEIGEQMRNLVESNVPTNNFYLRKDNSLNVDFYFVKTLDECVEILQKYKKKEEKITKFINDENLSSFLFQMYESSYIPRINYQASKIVSLQWKVGKIQCQLSSSYVLAPDNIPIRLQNPEVYTKFHKADFDFYQKILDKSLMSDYPDSVLD